jgi:hypothetical protein
MKKILITVFILILMTGCKKEPEELTNVFTDYNDFLDVTSNQIFTENTYYLDLELDDESNSLNVIGSLAYIVVDDTNELDLKLYLRINGETYNAAFSGNDRTTIHIDLNDDADKDSILFIEFSYSFDYWNDGRIAYYDDYYITMFFYPFVAMDSTYSLDAYDYSFQGESYYNEIGDYYVSIDVPSDFKTASSGKEVGSIEQGSRIQKNYYLNNGRDFSFSTSSLYYTYVEEIDGITHTIYSVDSLSSQVVEENFETLKNSFEIYQEYIGDYPYDYFNLEFGNIYGMESSGIVYCSNDISIYTVVHEIIHQWFYSIIHNDQANEPFLDEALTTYITFIYFYEVEGIENANGYLDSRDSFQERLDDYLMTYQGVSLLQSVHTYEEGYGYIIYYHGPTLYRYYFNELFGNDITVLKQFLQAYYNEYSFKEVTTIEMLELLEEITGYENTMEWFNEELDSLGIPKNLD